MRCYPEETLHISSYISGIQTKSPKWWAALFGNACVVGCVCFSPPILRFVLFHSSSRNRLVNSRHYLAIDTTRQTIMVMFSSSEGSKNRVHWHTFEDTAYRVKPGFLQLNIKKEIFLTSPGNVITVCQFGATILAYLGFVTRPWEATSHLLVQLRSGTFRFPPPT